MVFASSYDVKVFWRELFVTNDKKNTLVWLIKLMHLQKS